MNGKRREIPVTPPERQLQWCYYSPSIFHASSQTAPRSLSSFDTHARWQPITQSARSRRSYGKIEDCKQSSLNEPCGTLFWWWTSIWYLALASHLKFTPYLFGHGATKHKLLSLNVRGIRSFGRRKSIFNWLLKSPTDICFVQETYSTPEVGISIQNFKLYNLYKRETLFSCCSRIAKLHFLSRRSGIRRAFTLLLQDIFWLLETCLVLAKR